MYHQHSGTGYLGESSNTPSCVVNFVWPYGGRDVYLPGSFNAWTQWPMAPVEGRPTMFMILCRLGPGIHQYKFIVDGEGRHDEHQSHFSGTYGTVNTLVVAGGHDYLPAFLTPQTAQGSDMDVDTEAFQRVVRLTDVSVHETFPRISDSDLEASRRRISAFLSNHTVYELLPSSGKVTALDVDLPVKQAFHILYEQGIPMAPLFYFCGGRFGGMLTAVDFILIMKELRSHGINMTAEELETHTISAWKTAKFYIGGQVDKSERASSRELVQAGPDVNLQDVALRILQNRVSTVPVLHSTSLDGAYPQLLHLTSLCDILKSICRYFGSSLGSLPVLQRPICAIPLGTWVPKIGQTNQRPLAVLRPNACLTAAFELLVQAQVSSVPIVDDNGTLLDIYSRSDITALAKDGLYARINLDEITVHQALQLREESYLLFGLSRQSCQMCLPTDSVYSVMERLSKPGVRRLVIVEAGSKRVQGIVSISDVFRFLLGV